MHMWQKTFSDRIINLYQINDEQGDQQLEAIQKMYSSPTLFLWSGIKRWEVLTVEEKDTDCVT